MGYRVEYGPVKKIRGAEKRTARKSALTALCLLLFVLLVQTFWPEGAELLREMLIPGEPEITVAAMEDFARELRQGEPLAEAFSHFVFCLMEGGEVVPG